MTAGGLRRTFGPAVAASTMVLVIGAIAAVAREPLLFPSLGPTVFIQVHAPESEAARPWNNLAGHAVGIAAALLALALTGGGHDALLSWRREIAAAIAVGLTTAGQALLRAAHPPGAATTLLIALGAIAPEGRAVVVIAAGVASTVVLERALRPWILAAAGGRAPEKRTTEAGGRT